MRKSAQIGSKHHATIVWQAFPGILPGRLSDVPKRTAVHAGIGVEQWLGRPKTQPWRWLLGQGYLHFLVCTVLFISVLNSDRLHHTSATALLLWMGFGVAGTVFFAAYFACLEAYAFAGCPLPVPSWLQQDWLTPSKLVAMRNLQKLDRYICEAQEGILVALGLSLRLL